MGTNRLRMSGLISGLDTDSIISALVSTKQAAVDKKTGDKTKLSWKQDIWKDLNKELKSLQSMTASMRYTSSFAKKTTTPSNSSKVSVITGDTAVESVQSLKVDSLAKTAYLTGGKVDTTDGKNATALSTLGELGFSGTGIIKIDGTEKTININSSTTISDVLSALQDAGLNASFDEKNQRIFASAKKSGAEYNFSLSSDTDDGNDALAKLGLQNADYYKSKTSYTDSQVNETINARLTSYLTTYNDMKSQGETISSKIEELATKIGVASDADIDSLLTSAKTNLDALKKELEELSTESVDYTTKKKQLDEDILSEQTKVDDLTSLQVAKTDLKKTDDVASGLEVYFDNLHKDSDGKYVATASNKLKEQVDSDYEKRASEASDKIANSKTQYAVMIEGADASIRLNGATFTSSSNVFEINGLTITTMGTTTDDEEITLTTQQDTSGIYDMIKNYITKYNSIINKLDELYNAESSSKMSPLTDEEKDAMSETEAEKYEQKIKDGLLKGDSTINTLISSLSGIMSSGINIGTDNNPKVMYLSDFGISTLDYFTAAANERHAYHIDGDEKDDSTSGNEDKLKAMITSNPDYVVDFFTKISQNIYQKMSDLSSSVAGYRTFGSFYDDKKMSSDITDYTSKIAEMQEKVNDYEDKLYSQYATMESNLAKLQSNSSAVTSLLGS